MKTVTSVGARGWSVRNAAGRPEAGPSMTGMKHAKACSRVRTQTPHRSGEKGHLPVWKAECSWDRGLSAPSFARSGLVAFRGSVLPVAPVWGGGRVALSLFSLSRGKEGESRKKPPCSYLVCLLEKLEIRVAGLGVKCCLSPLEWTALERDEVCGPNVCFFVRAANWRYCSSGKLCELRLSLVFPSGSPSSRALSASVAAVAWGPWAGRPQRRLPCGPGVGGAPRHCGKGWRGNTAFGFGEGLQGGREFTGKG